MDETRGGNISSEAAFKMLRVLAGAEQPLGVADLHRLTGEPTSSVHRAIATLEETGYAARYQGSARFMPGRMCNHLVRALVARYAIRRTAQPYLARLVDLAAGTGTVNVRLGWYSLRVLALDGRLEYVENRRIGQPRYLHEDLAPLTMLCFMRERDRQRYVAFLARQTGRRAESFGVPALARAALRDGYALRRDQAREDRAWLGFPLMGADGQPASAISLSTPTASDGSVDPELLAEIRSTVEALQRDIAANPARCDAPFATLDPDTIRLAIAPPA
jgi:DNA-binding IclR family transcriptional regulator